jgi:hypothetical protein
LQAVLFILPRLSGTFLWWREARKKITDRSEAIYSLLKMADFILDFTKSKRAIFWCSRLGFQRLDCVENNRQ